MATTGDRAPGLAVDRFDTKGIFVDTIRRAVLDGDCDLAVHSLKDLPSEEVPGLTIGAVPARGDPRDALVTRDGVAFSALPDGARVGTSSERRRVQLLAANPSLEVVAVRGNLDTRLRKVADGRIDALVVALAGLERLTGGPGAAEADLPATPVPLTPDECLPAAGQGALAVECRADDAEALAVCAQVEDHVAHRHVRAERAFLARLGGGCLAPVGALARSVDERTLELTGLVADPVGGAVARLARRGAAERPEALGVELADRLRAEGGEELLASIARVRGHRESGEAAH